MLPPLFIRFSRSGRKQTAAALILLCGFPVMLLSGLGPHVLSFATAASVCFLADGYLQRTRSSYLAVLSKARFGVSVRSPLRQLLLLLLLVRVSAESAVLVTAITFAVCLTALQLLHVNLVRLIKLRGKAPLVVHNIDWPCAAPTALSKRLARAARRMDRCDVPAALGLILTAATGRPSFGFAGVTLASSLAVAYSLVLVPFARRPAAASEAVLGAANSWLATYTPTVILYFSGSKRSVYQANMWLRIMESLDARVLVVVRERAVLDRLDQTSLPVMCVPGAVNLMNLDLSSVRVALYASNVGKNIHLLREPGIKHVFIGHGDSDKAASVNPFSKVYDEIWVAGPAGRERYALAGIGVRDKDIVEVGRPQLNSITGQAPSVDRPVPTILYAPTWEGWTDEPGNTSLVTAGVTIVHELLAMEPPVRVLYRPHPLTGIRSPQALAAHRNILALLAENARARSVLPCPAAQCAQHDLHRIETELATLGRPDEAAVAPGGPGPWERIRLLRQERDRAYWQAHGPLEHRALLTDAPGLHDCFNQADALVSDVSSVVSDFLASGKPYAVADSAEIGAEAFRERNIATRAGIVVSNAGDGLDELVAAVLDPAKDDFHEERQLLRDHLLGPAQNASLARFNEAVNRLKAEVEARSENSQRPDGTLPAARDTPLN